MATRGNTLGAERLVAQVAAVFSIGAGVIHVSAAGDHTNLRLMFVGFLAVAAAQVVLGAVLMWRRPSRWVVVAGIALMVGAIGVWVLSRTEGLPFLEDGHTEPVGFKDGVTVLFEAASLPALLLLLSRDLERVSLPSARLETQTLTALGMCCFALMVPALMLDGGGHHSHEQAVALGIHADDHGEDEALAHTDTQSHEKGAETGHHTAKSEQKSAHDGDGGHKHSGAKLASAPLGGSHEHSGDSDSGNRPAHHDDDTDGGKNHNDRHRGDHRRGRPDRDHGHGDHEGDDPAAEPGDEQPISISYGPEPSVCVGTVCVP